MTDLKKVSFDGNTYLAKVDGNILTECGPMCFKDYVGDLILGTLSTINLAAGSSFSVTDLSPDDETGLRRALEDYEDAKRTAMARLVYKVYRQEL